MSHPIVQVQTRDGLWLHGLLIESAKKETILINIHGTASNFYEEDFINVLSDALIVEGVSVLSTNNRGVGVYDAYQKKGAATELFADSVFDIDAWIKFAIDQGYKKIVLSGHSLGTEKVVYYMSEGNFTDKVSVIILFAPASSPGYNIYGDDYKPSIKKKDKVDSLIAQSKSLIEQGRGEVFLDQYAYADLMPKSAESFVDFSHLNPEFDKALPFEKGTLPAYSKLMIPILVLIGDVHEYTAIPPADALQLMKKENALTEPHLLKGSDHDFDGHENDVARISIDFLGRNRLLS